MTSQGPPQPPSGKLVLLRHGETEWSLSGKHTGLTDLPLTRNGEEAARSLAPTLADRHFALVLSSPLQRARRTAELAGLTGVEVDDNLLEWDYGGYEGRTTDEIRAELGYDWNVFHQGVVPGETPGETVEDVAARTRKVIDRAWPALYEGDVALAGHGHCLRILAAVWLRQEPRFGAQVDLHAGSLSVLGHKHEDPAIITWNRSARI